MNSEEKGLTARTAAQYLRNSFLGWNIDGLFGERGKNFEQALVDALSAAEERGKKAGLESAAQYMESRKVTASEFYAREIRALALTPTAQEKEQER